MRANRSTQAIATSLVAAVCLVVLPEACHAAKGGNGGGGGGKPGNDPPIEIPVRYSVTKVLGAGLSYSDHNEVGGVVGSTGGATRSAVAYLPTIASTARELIDLPGIQGIPSSWSPRNAFGINGNGDIVGDLDSASRSQRLPYLLTDVYSSAPQLTVLGPFDAAAESEQAWSINDRGDVVGSSEKTVGGVVERSVYVGNPELNVPFSKVNFPAGWSVYGVDDLQLTNGTGTSQPILAGSVVDNATGQPQIFRMNLDGSGFGVSPIYTDAAGYQHSWSGVLGQFSWPIDLNEQGAITGAAWRESTGKGKGKQNPYTATWEYGASQYTPAGGADASIDWGFFAVANDDLDYLLTDTEWFDTLWHQEWSEQNGALAIRDLIDPNDPDGALFVEAYELTNRDSSDWPTILAGGTEVVDGVEHRRLLILTPELVSASQAVSIAVPEPSAALLIIVGIAMTSILNYGPGGRRRHAKS